MFKNIFSSFHFPSTISLKASVKIAGFLSLPFLVVSCSQGIERFTDQLSSGNFSGSNYNSGSVFSPSAANLPVPSPAVNSASLSTPSSGSLVDANKDSFITVPDPVPSYAPQPQVTAAQQATTNAVQPHSPIVRTQATQPIQHQQRSTQVASLQPQSGSGSYLSVPDPVPSSSAQLATSALSSVNSPRPQGSSSTTPQSRPTYVAPVSPAPVQSEPPKQVTKISTTPKTEDTLSSSGGTFRWPVTGKVIGSFGELTDGVSNDGIDISAPSGTPIKAAESGSVIYAGDSLLEFGNLVLVSHSDGWVTAYAHASKLRVKRGDKVARGDIIADSGATGNTKSPKVHFELRKNSKPVDPLLHLAQN